MIKRNFALLLAIPMLLAGCSPAKKVTTRTAPTTQKAPFVWEGANLYFLLTDRFNNGDKSNDVNFGRTKQPAK